MGMEGEIFLSVDKMKNGTCVDKQNDTCRAPSNDSCDVCSLLFGHASFFFLVVFRVVKF
jgi:hypothetical protein